jgi:hypothetical protein
VSLVRVFLERFELVARGQLDGEAASAASAASAAHRPRREP